MRIAENVLIINNINIVGVKVVPSAWSDTRPWPWAHVLSVDGNDDETIDLGRRRSQVVAKYNYFLAHHSQKDDYKKAYVNCNDFLALWIVGVTFIDWCTYVRT